MRFMFLAACVVLVAVLAQAEDLQVTVYNSNIAVVKATQTVKLERGVNTISVTDVAARIDPTSVRLKIGGMGRIDVLEQNFEYDLVSPNRLLEKYIDNRIVAATTEDRVYAGKLLGFDNANLVIATDDGKVAMVSRNKLSDIELGPGETGLITRPTLFWKVDSSRRTSAMMELAYITEGINWHAEYVAILGQSDETMSLAAWVSIENRSGATYPDARLKLVAGEIHRVRERPYPPTEEYKLARAVAAPLTERPFFEYHIYTLEGETTIRDREVKQIRLFPETEVTAEKEYNYDAQREDAVRVVMKFENSSEAGLGFALPAGKVRVYKADEDGSLEFVGEDAIDHTPKDEQVKIYIGNAFDITATRTRTDYKKISERRIEESFEIEIANHKEEDVMVVVTEHIYGDWQIRRSSHAYEKTKANEVEFKVDVPANGKAVLSYTVRRRF